MDAWVAAPMIHYEIPQIQYPKAVRTYGVGAVQKHDESRLQVVILQLTVSCAQNVAVTV